MFEYILFITNGVLLLLFGINLSAAFAGVKFTKRNFLYFLCLGAFCGALQVLILLLSDESLLWKLYPLVAHLPIILFLNIVYRKRIITALAAVSTAYLCCQPSKWFGVLTISITGNIIVEYVVRNCVLIIVAFIVLRFLASYLSDIFNKETRDVYIFGILPMVYYVFDYTTVIYTNLWTANNRIVAEFLPFFLCVIYVIFCFVYYKEYEQKADAKRNEQIVRITAQQQAKEMKAVKRSEHEIRILRHDMRLFLNSLAVCIENNKTDHAMEMISSFTSHIEGTRIERFCNNEVINYVLSDFAEKCKNEQVQFLYAINWDGVIDDEIVFSSILSNALDNALNAQQELSEESRYVDLMLKSSQGKLLLSVKNPIQKKPVFSDGLPITNQDGHGYGTQSIRYMTERLGGNCQFNAQDNVFITRVIING